MSSETEIVVRGRCACGRRFRVRHAQAGLVVRCPNCDRPITLTEADLRAAAAAEPLLPLQPEQAEAVEAVLLDEARLRPAAQGARPGLTGRTLGVHEEALLAEALNPGLRSTSGWAGALPTAASDATSPARGFLTDLLASFYFGGHPVNAWLLLASAAGCALPLLFVAWVSGFAVGPGVSLLGLVMLGLVGLYVVRFYWRTLTLTAAGEDRIPLTDGDWDWLDDALRPLLWIGAITALCALPAGLAWWYVPAQSHRLAWTIAAAVLGSSLWPVALMSVALGESLLFVRPDWLIRCIVAIGPVYLLAWLLVVATGGAVAGLVVLGMGAAPWPPALQLLYVPSACFALLYLGYIVFRTAGLLFRHYRHRFPWRY